jgi:hypothetical protein
MIKIVLFVTEPFIGPSGKCHQQRGTSDKKATTSVSQHHQAHPQQPPLPRLVPPPEDLQQVTVAMRPVGCADLEDLIHLAGPLTEDALLKCLQARFCASQFFVSTCMLVKVSGYHGGHYEECHLLGYKSQFIPHRKHITSPLQSPHG